MNVDQLLSAQREASKLADIARIIGPELREQMQGLATLREQEWLQEAVRQQRELAQMLRERTQLREIIDGARIASQTQRMVEELKAASLLGQHLSAFHADIVDRIRREVEMWSHLYRGFSFEASEIARLSASVQTWHESFTAVAARLSVLDIPNLYPNLSSLLLEPGYAYGAFARGVWEEFDGDGVREAVISASLSLTERHVSVGMESAIEVAGGIAEGEDTTDTKLIVNIFERQHGEIITASGLVISSSVDDLLNAVPTARLIRRSLDIADLAMTINEAAQVRGDDEVFRLTTRYAQAQNQLPWVAARNRTELGLVVDCLYFMLYEGTGEASRLTPRYVTQDECGSIWTVKHLRSKWLRHDPNRGEPGKQRASWRTIGTTLSRLGLNCIPATPDEYLHLQEAVLRDVEDFLRRLHDRISES